MSAVKPYLGDVPPAPRSPHYSRVGNRKARDSRSDGRLAAALDAVREVARLDPDKAKVANAAGFSVSDVSLGHRLALLSTEQLRKDPVASGQALALAARYRRQVPNRLRVAIGATDQHDLFE